MTAIPLTLNRTPPRTRPDLPADLVATPVLAQVGNLDDLMEGNTCSCAASDDNPH